MIVDDLFSAEQNGSKSHASPKEQQKEAIMYPFHHLYAYHRYPVGCGYLYGCGYGYPYSPLYAPRYNLMNNQLAYSNQSLYNSGYMAGVTQSSVINNVGGLGGIF